MRDYILKLDRELSRRSFLGVAAKGAALVAAFDRFGGSALGAALDQDAQLTFDQNLAMRVYQAIGDIVIPVDEDPGWRNFEPGISDYGLNVFAKQVLLGGNDIAFQGLIGSLNFFNEAPVLVGTGPKFLDSVPAAQVQYFTNILAGQFEKAGVQDIISFSILFGLVSTRAVFFSNYPYHIAQDAEFQTLPANKPRTGWDILKWKGPISQAEEAQLRARYQGITVLPGIDRRNPYI
ncbi:MAG: hypothetical protein A3F68_13465 [Acidobacteria bacterium RIFCSPLOWO2_12_FULL_54_10]|nr:MAG: hypothetical protein A3F68_13465 [Acidobacteria bacterium RIFCSPLOWO2_12_FULL_54_10]